MLVKTDHFTHWCDATPYQMGRLKLLQEPWISGVLPTLGYQRRFTQIKDDSFSPNCFMCVVSFENVIRHRPQANLMVEGLNRTLGNSLRALLIDYEQEK